MSTFRHDVFFFRLLHSVEQRQFVHGTVLLWRKSDYLNVANQDIFNLLTLTTTMGDARASANCCHNSAWRAGRYRQVM